jgi:hypothetical protein
LSGISGDDGRGAIETRIHDLAREHWAIRNMNCWPMNRSTFHKYAPVEIVSNVAPVLVGPLLSFTDGAVSGQAAGPSDFIGALTSFLRTLFL